MYRDTTYKEKFSILKEWTPEILEEIKKELRNEHIRQDFVFIKKYLKGKNPNKITLEDMVEGYTQAIDQEEKGEDIAEFVANRWMLHMGDVYSFFESELARFQTDFTEIKEIPSEQAKDLIHRSSEKFGAPKTYLFAVINSVAFSKDHFDQLRQKASHERTQKKENDAQLHESQNFEKLKREFEGKLQKMKEKYDDKMEGLQKKYVVDTSSLKKQISQMQKKLNANA